MFTYQPSYYTTSPFDSYYAQSNPYTRAALVQRQREIEAAHRNRICQERARLAEARRIQQLRLQQEEAQLHEAYAQQLRNQRRSQYFTQPDQEYEDEEEQYYQHPFLPFAFGPQRRRRTSVARRPQHGSTLQEVSETLLFSSSVPVTDFKNQSTRPAPTRSINIPVSSGDGSRDRDEVKASTPSDTPSSAARPYAFRAQITSPAETSVINERRNVAASAIQTSWRAYALRKKAMAQISAIHVAFQELQSSFTFPVPVDFVETSSPAAPHLAYTTNNRPILSYEHEATKLLTRLDAIDSAGDAQIRAGRKALVNDIEDALKALESMKLDAWNAQQTAAQSTSSSITSSSIPSVASEVPSSSVSDNEPADEEMSQSEEEEEAIVLAAVSEPEDMVLVEDEDDEDDEDTWVDASAELLQDAKNAEAVNMQSDELSEEQEREIAAL